MNRLGLTEGQHVRSGDLQSAHGPGCSLGTCTCTGALSAWVGRSGPRRQWGGARSRWTGVAGGVDGEDVRRAAGGSTDASLMSSVFLLSQTRWQAGGEEAGHSRPTQKSLCPS